MDCLLIYFKNYSSSYLSPKLNVSEKRNVFSNGFLTVEVESDNYNLEYVKKFYIENPQEALKIRESGLFEEETYMSIYKHMYDSEKTTFIPTDIMQIIKEEEKVETD